MAKRNIGGLARKRELSLQDIAEIEQGAYERAKADLEDQFERVRRLNHPRHPDCQMCDYLYERDELQQENRRLRIERDARKSRR